MNFGSSPAFITCGFMYHSPLQPALLLMTTTLIHYYFFPSPGFEPGYFFKRAGLHALCHSHWQVDGVFGIFHLWVLYHSALQRAVVLRTTSLFDYYFLPVPGFEPGYLCQRAGIVSTRPLSLTTGWSFWYILLLSTYLQVQQRYTHNKTQVQILLSPPLTTDKEQVHT